MTHDHIETFVAAVTSDLPATRKVRNELTMCNNLLLYNTHIVVIKPYTMEHTSTTSGNATVPRACPMVCVVARDFLTHTSEDPEMFNMLQES